MTRTIAAAEPAGPKRSTRGDGGMAAPARQARPSIVPKQPLWKRAMDVGGALAGLLVLAPFLLLTGCVIRVVSPGPALFRQQRVGVEGRPFTIWKFRTMRTNTDSRRHQEYVAGMVGADVPLTKLDDRHELIPLGGLLRALCIDELPQLVNVLRGEMSLVGPRPDVIPYEVYQPWQRRRFEVLPGITGLWQVSGKNHTTFAEMVRLDVDYVEQRSFRLDLRILLMTIPAIMCQRLNQPATQPLQRGEAFSLSGTESVSKE